MVKNRLAQIWIDFTTRSMKPIIRFRTANLNRDQVIRRLNLNASIYSRSHRLTVGLNGPIENVRNHSSGTRMDQ
jgi:hypothetical protein